MTTFFEQFCDYLEYLTVVEPENPSHVCKCTTETGLSDHCKMTLAVHGFQKTPECLCAACQDNSSLVQRHIDNECNACAGTQSLFDINRETNVTCWWCCSRGFYPNKDINKHRVKDFCITKAKAIYKSLCGLHPSVCDDHIAVEHMEVVVSYIENNTDVFRSVYPNECAHVVAPVDFIKKSKELDRAVKYLQAVRDCQHSETGIVFQQAKSGFEKRAQIVELAQAEGKPKKKRRKQSASTKTDS